MLKTRLILIAICAFTVWLIFLLPKSVVENESEMKGDKSKASAQTLHATVDPKIQQQINQLRAKLTSEPQKRNSAIFADSLVALYQKAARFDSAAWHAEQANMFFETTDSKLKTGEAYYQAFSFALDNTKRNELAERARQFFQQVLEADAKNLDVRTKMALTYIGTATPMLGITMLREVLVEDPKFKPALFNMGMLSVQSGQYAKAIEWLNKLLAVAPEDVQGRLLLGVAFSNSGEKEKAREQFEMAKKLDSDPTVQQQADAYLKDLK